MLVFHFQRKNSFISHYILPNKVLIYVHELGSSVTFIIQTNIPIFLHIYEYFSDICKLLILLKKNFVRYQMQYFSNLFIIS